MNYKSIFLIVLTAFLISACTSKSNACYSLADLENLPETTFLPRGTELVSRRISDGEGFEESPYYGIVQLVVGSNIDRNTFLQAYDQYLTSRGWVRISDLSDETLWDKSGVHIDLRFTEVDQLGHIEEVAQENYRTWYIVSISEPKAKTLSDCDQS